MMKNSMVESVTITLGLVLSAGVSARAETYFEDFATGNHLDPATNYGFTQIVGGDSHVRFGMDIDPLGLALFGGGTWAQWNIVAIDPGLSAQPNKVTVFSCDASAAPPADGPGGNTATSQWGSFAASAHDVSLGQLGWGGIKWGAEDTNADPTSRHGWVFEPGHVTGVTQEFFIDGYLGTYDEIDGKQELVVHLEIWVDRINNQVWGTIDDGVTKTTTPKYTMTQN